MEIGHLERVKGPAIFYKARAIVFPSLFKYKIKKEWETLVKSKQSSMMNVHLHLHLRLLSDRENKLKSLLLYTIDVINT